jgi:hypothetical protein
MNAYHSALASAKMATILRANLAIEQCRPSLDLVLRLMGRRCEANGKPKRMLRRRQTASRAHGVWPDFSPLRTVSNLKKL